MFAQRFPSTLLYLLAVFYLTTRTLGVTISTIGDVNIKISNHQFICDKIQCPANTDRCVVTKQKDPNNAAVLVRSNMCHSKANEVLKKSITYESIDPKSKVNVHIVASRNGVISSVNSFNSQTSKDFDEEKFKQEFSKKMSNFRQRMTSRMERLGTELLNMGQKYAYF